MRGSSEPNRLRLRFIPGVAALLLLFSIVAQAQQSDKPGQPSQSRLIRIIAQDEVNNPVSGVAVQIKRGAEVVGAIVTDEKGEAAATNLAPGKYEIVVTKEGFETLAQQEVTRTADADVEDKFTLGPQIAVSETERIGATPPA